MTLQVRSSELLGACGLPTLWAGKAQWQMLATAFGLGASFLATWAAWRADANRPRMLHFVALCEAPPSGLALQAATTEAPELAALASTLAPALWGLVPGMHRLSFEQGQVLLTLCIGEPQAHLRQLTLAADTVFLDAPGLSAASSATEMPMDPHWLKTVARACRQGARLALPKPPTREALPAAWQALLAPCGLTLAEPQAQSALLQATYAPRWQPRGAPPLAPSHPTEAIVVGAGLAGAAVAASLARRGWQVRVLDRAEHPASGASGLPAGVFAPHVSPDDSLLSRLSRSGIRLTLATAAALLHEGKDWGPSGVLEQCLDGKRRLPESWAQGPGQDWSQPASASTLAAAGLPPEALANWHPQGGWIRPARLVAALLAQPGIRWQGQACVQGLVRDSARGLWQLTGPGGSLLGEASLVVLATGAGSIDLCAPFWPQAPLRPLRGQVSMGASQALSGLPPFPVNGHGNFIPQVPAEPGAGGPFWVMGSTFERGERGLPLTPAQQAAGHIANAEKLRALLPPLAETLAPAIEAGQGIEAWAAVRCTVPDRVPVVGPVDAQALPGLWVSTAMGARGLTLSLVCGELLAARLHGEPLPLEAKLAQALSSERLREPQA